MVSVHKTIALCFSQAVSSSTSHSCFVSYMDDTVNQRTAVSLLLRRPQVILQMEFVNVIGEFFGDVGADQSNTIGVLYDILHDNFCMIRWTLFAFYCSYL